MTSPLPAMPVPHGQAEEREVLRDHPKPFTEVYRGRWQAGRADEAHPGTSQAVPAIASDD